MQLQNKWMHSGVRFQRKKKGGKCSGVKHEVRWEAAKPKLKITYMHHGRVEMYVYGTIKCRETTRTTER